MMDLATIHQLSRQAGREARRKHKAPFVPTAAQKLMMRNTGDPCGPIPFLGTFTPPGWRKVGEPWFCDSSGFGKTGEPAHSFEQFARKLADLKEGHGVAVTESGQFQVYVQVFAPVKSRAAR